jgi:hypothetical protein
MGLKSAYQGVKYGWQQLLGKLEQGLARTG